MSTSDKNSHKNKAKSQKDEAKKQGLEKQGREKQGREKQGREKQGRAQSDIKTQLQPQPQLTNEAKDETINVALKKVLGRAKEIGLLGRKLTIEEAIKHSQVYEALFLTSITPELSNPPLASKVDELEDNPRHIKTCIDLGSGAGLPGLLFAHWEASRGRLQKNAWTQNNWVLSDRSQKSIDFLRWAVKYLKLDTQVLHTSVEKLNETYDYVVSRAFAPPAITAECISHILKVGGKAIISDAPFSSGTIPSSSNIPPSSAVPPNVLADSASHSALHSTPHSIISDRKDTSHSSPKSFTGRWSHQKLELLGFEANFVQISYSFVILEKLADTHRIRRSWKSMTQEPLW